MLTITFVSAGILEMLLPLVLGFFLWKKYSAQWKVFFVGAFAFILSQIIHIPLLSAIDWLLTQMGIGQSWPEIALIGVNAFILGAMAALCEEPVRWLSFRYLKKEGEPFRSALMLGAGHGGVESILVGLSVLSSAISLIMWQNGSLPIPADQAAAFESLVDTQWWLPLLGLFERVAAVGLHISLSALVWLSVRTKKSRFFLLALLWHFLVDAAVVFLGGLGWSALALEGVMAVVLVISLFVLFHIYQTHGKETLFAPETIPSVPPLEEGS